MQSNKNLGSYFTISLGGGRGFDVNSAEDATKFAVAMDMAFEQLEKSFTNNEKFLALAQLQIQALTICQLT